MSKAFSIDPAVSGTLDWDNRYSGYDKTTIIFYPANGLKKNTKYTIKINTEAEDMFGSKMKEPYSFSFITSPE